MRKLDEVIRRSLKSILERMPEGAIETKSFALDQADLAEKCEVAKTRGEQWAEAPRSDEQIGLFDE